VLPREQGQANRERVARLRRGMGWQRPCPARRPRTADSARPDPRGSNLVQRLQVTHPDHVWVGESTSGRLPKAFVSFAGLRAVDPRALRGWPLSRHLAQALTWAALRRALARPRPATHRSGQGARSAAAADSQTPHARGVRIRRAAIGAPAGEG
jgi:hypothetical protein